MANNVYASCVSVDCQGVLLIGGSGTGKSDLALRLIMDKKAVLVADDRVELELRNSLITASAPLPLKGLLEVRGIGIMTFPCLSEVPLSLAVRLNCAEEKTERLPAPEFFEFDGVRIPQIRLCAFEASAAAKIIAFLHNPLADV